MSKASRQTQALLALIDDVYAMAAGTLAWSELAPRLAATFEAPSAQASIRRSDQSSLRLSTTANFPAVDREYAEYFYQKDIWVQRAADRAGLSQVVTSQQLVDEQEFLRLEFYQDWCRRLGVFHLVGAVFPAGHNEVGVIGIHRERRSHGFDEAERRRVARFLPHLERAVRFRQYVSQVRLEQRLAATTLDRSDLGVLLVLHDGTLLHANAVAETLLRGSVGLRCKGGRVGAAETDDQSRFATLLAAACASASGLPQDEAWMGLRSRGRICASVLVAPFKAPWQGEVRACAIVFVREVRRRLVVAPAARAIFGLTAAEARIAEGLVNGATVVALAARQGTSPQTVRKQLNGLLQRMGVKRQSDCVAVLLRAIAAVGPDERLR